MKKKAIISMIAAAIAAATPAAAAGTIPTPDAWKVSGATLENITGSVYADALLVYDVCDQGDGTAVFCCVAQNGNEFFYLDDSDSDIFADDIVAVVMDDMGTDVVMDDVILSVKYAGWLDDGAGWIR